MREPLKCKDEGHSMLRIRPTFAKRNSLRDVSIPTRQERAKGGLCWRCGSDQHEAAKCKETVRASADDVEVEE